MAHEPKKHDKHGKHEDEYDEYYNETSNTAAGINTPRDHENSGPLDMVSKAVEEFVENIRHPFDGHHEEDKHKPKH